MCYENEVECLDQALNQDQNNPEYWYHKGNALHMLKRYDDAIKALDKATDIDMAHNAGLTSILVRTGYGESVLSGNYQHSTKPDYSSSDLLDAVDWIKKKTHLRPQKKSRQDRI